jgi:hypothetical protein
MARYRRNKLSLYEAMTRSRRRKGGYGRSLEKVSGSGTVRRDERPEKAAEGKPAEQESDVQIPLYQPATTWWKRARAVQFNTGRIEFSVSYPVAVAIILGLILLALLAFRAGQYYSAGRSADVNPTGLIPAQPKKADSGSVRNVTDLSARRMADESAVPPADESTRTVVDESPAEAKVEFTPLKGGNVIVLVEYPKRADLVPVQKHFSQFGISTEIVSWGGKYFLITRDRYEGFGAGSDGYEAKQKIVEVGAKYQAPDGYETFAPLLFRDAYGKKIE